MDRRDRKVFRKELERFRDKENASRLNSILAFLAYLVAAFLIGMSVICTLVFTDDKELAGIVGIGMLLLIGAIVLPILVTQRK